MEQPAPPAGPGRGTPEGDGGGVLDSHVARYLDVLLPPPDALALAMRNVAEAEGMPIAPAGAGELVRLLTRLHRPENVLEVGTGVGFLTLLVARELGPRGAITSVERDPIRQSQAHAFLERDGLHCAIELRLGEAAEVLESEPRETDLLLLGGRGAGADLELFEQLIDLVVPGGLVVVCGVLYGGAVAHGADVGGWPEPAVERRRAFNRRFVLDGRLDRPVILPVGDGVAVATRTR